MATFELILGCILIGLFVLIAIVILVQQVFFDCSHPENYATFVRNISGDEIMYSKGRSLWKIKYYPFLLEHENLWNQKDQNHENTNKQTE